MRQIVARPAGLFRARATSAIVASGRVRISSRVNKDADGDGKRIIVDFDHPAYPLRPVLQQMPGSEAFHSPPTTSLSARPRLIRRGPTSVRDRRNGHWRLRLWRSLVGPPRRPSTADRDAGWLRPLDFRRPHGLQPAPRPTRHHPDRRDGVVRLVASAGPRLGPTAQCCGMIDRPSKGRRSTIELGSPDVEKAVAKARLQLRAGLVSKHCGRKSNAAWPTTMRF